MSENRETILISRLLSGEATPNELQELEELLNQDPEAASRLRVIKQFWEQQQPANSINVEAGLQKVLTALELPIAQNKISTTRRIPVWLKVAAAVMIAAAIAFTLRSTLIAGSRDTISALTEKHNSKGTKSTIELADGSKIWLNADSKISYPAVFAGNTREVYLNGEAFFEVAKNPAKPFIIHLANGTVRVLGTSFNVRAYDNEKVVETSVSTGKVAFIPDYKQTGKKKDTIFILPDNKIKYFLAKDEVESMRTSAVEDKAWTEGKLVFKSMTMQEIAVELERNFGKKVVFVENEPKNYLLTGSFQNNTLDDIMYYLSRTKNFNYKITNTELVISLSADSLNTYNQ